MKYIKATCEVFKISTEKACKLFDCTIDDLVEIYNAEKDLSPKALYNFINETQVSLSFIMEGKATCYNDNLVINYVQATNKNILQKKRFEELISYLGNNGIDIQNYPIDILELFNKELDEVNGEALIKANDFKLYSLIKKKYNIKHGNYHIDGITQYIDSWDVLFEKIGESLVLSNTITDPQFVLEFKEPKNNLLAAYRNAQIKWNSKAILHLISIGSSFGRSNPVDGVFMPDMLLTNLLKDYCERHIDE